MVPWGKNPQDHGLVVKVVEITPNLARTWMKFNTRNRNLKPEKIRQYTEDITNGQWVLNGEPIIFSWIPAQEEWQLDDGQNRLQAIIQADISIISLVVFGPSFDETMRTTGSGATRTTSEMLQISGENDPNVLSGALTLQWKLDRQDSTGQTLLADSGKNKFPSKSQVVGVLDAHPGIRDAVDATRQVAKVTGLYPSVAAFLYYRFMQVDESDCNWFFDHLKSGADPRTEGQHMDEGSHPIRVLREWLIHDKVRGKNKRDQVSRGFITKSQLGSVIKAWNLYMNGEPANSTYKIVYRPASGSRPAEKWPTIYNPLADDDPAGT